MKLIDRIKKPLSKIYIPLAWTLMILILLAMPGNMLPSEQGFSIPNFDKMVHFTLFGALVFFWCFYFYSKPITVKKLLLIFFIVFLCAGILGIGMEYVQKYFIPFRDFEEGDIIADIIGASIAYGICNVWLIEEKNSH
jgi:VanZ family protein